MPPGAEVAAIVVKAARGSWRCARGFTLVHARHQISLPRISRAHSSTPVKRVTHGSDDLKIAVWSTANFVTQNGQALPVMHLKNGMNLYKSTTWQPGARWHGGCV